VLDNIVLLKCAKYSKEPSQQTDFVNLQQHNDFHYRLNAHL